jgi:hypothetical protein
LRGIRILVLAAAIGASVMLGRSLQSAAAIIDEDDRRTEADYAREHGETLAAVKARYAATGRITCGQAGEAMANLAGRNDILITANHLTVDTPSCRKLVDPAACWFVVEVNGRERRIRIERQLASGFRCPGSTSVYDDWAVMKLAEPVVGITPYKIDTYAITKAKPGDQVVAVSRSADFRRAEEKDGKRVYVLPKHVGDCRLRAIREEQWIPYYMLTDCDGSWGSSGGGLLTLHRDRPRLLAIRVGSSETDEQARRAAETGVPIRRAYDEKSWSSGFVPVADRLYRALMDVLPEEER